MLVRHRHRKALRAWHWVAAVAAVTILLAAYAAPMSAAAGNTTLSNASVSPRTGTTRTVITVSVVYRNAKSSRAENVTVHLGTDHHGMKQVRGGDWGHGVTFRWSGTVREGTQKISITARGRDKSEAILEAGSVTIAKKGTTPPPTAKPTPKPTAKPAARATPRPTRKPVVIAKTIARVTTTPAPTPLVPAAAASTEPEPTPLGPPITAVLGGLAGVDPGGPDAGGSGPSAGSAGGGQGGSSGTDIPANPRGGGDGGDGGGRRASGPLTSFFAAVGFSGPTFPPLSLAPTLVTTSGAVATAMAFGLFGRRRRDDEEIPDDVLAAAAAAGLAVGPAQLVGAAAQSPFRASEIGAGGAGGAVGDRPAADGRAAAPVDPPNDEMLMPRWRRPSLIQARKADPVRDSMPAPRLTFGQGFVGPLAGRERRVIRYRVVRLLDSPDELRGAEIGYLDQGDEVQLLEKYGAYWLVVSPDGQQGWLHKMVLGEAVEADGSTPVDVPVATMPTVADSWTMGESDVDSDVFDAYLQARRREA